jgi:phage terminase small subunit
MLNPKQEKVMQNYLTHGNKTKAFKDAGYGGKSNEKTLNEEACKFFANPKISTRLKDLRLEVAEKSLVTLQNLNERLIWVADTCKEEKQFNALNQAIAHLARLNGIEPPTRIQQQSSTKLITSEELTPQQKRNLIKLLQ